MSISADKLTRDAFLGGRLHLWQPRGGYRAGVDPVLLAASVGARAGQSVLDLGCGVGTALLCLGARVPQLDLWGLELQPDYAALARRNAAGSGQSATILTGDLGEMPPELRARRFDHVIANPPYFAAGDGTAATRADRETALRETRALEEWLVAGLSRLAPRGRMAVIQRADRAPDLIARMSARLGGLVVRPVQPRTGRDASLVIVSGRSAVRTPARLAAPFVLHDGAAHGASAEVFSAEARAVLRDGAALPQ